MPELIIAYIPSPTQEVAQTMALHLLEQKLIACANIVPSISMYWWQGENKTQEEHILIVKTLPNQTQKLEEEIKKVHPYQTPCILKISARANEQYYRWVSHEVAPGESS
jgi:periplasmic divalent cation tolerance protein